MSTDPIDRTEIPGPDGGLVSRLVAFVRSIGLSIRFGEVAHRTPLPGIDVVEGVIVVDRARLRFPGDLLHEAGHLAVVEASERARSESLDSPGNEMASIAWSYAAALHLGLDPSIVFHEEGYRGDSPMILENFGSGRTFGVPLLAWYGLTVEPKHGEPREGRYPAMLRWVRD